MIGLGGGVCFALIEQSLNICVKLIISNVTHLRGYPGRHSNKHSEESYCNIYSLWQAAVDALHFNAYLQ